MFPCQFLVVFLLVSSCHGAAVEEKIITSSLSEVEVSENETSFAALETLAAASETEHKSDTASIDSKMSGQRRNTAAFRSSAGKSPRGQDAALGAFQKHAEAARTEEDVAYFKSQSDFALGEEISLPQRTNTAFPPSTKTGEKEVAVVQEHAASSHTNEGVLYFKSGGTRTAGQAKVGETVPQRRSHVF
eukprot:CAMPEP_0194499882 /NCGR_PEP_ID=MMETSP0253-20130528/16049_1 /TAXON_ID=2966 /ORGANISM="Noctiluca scintillans" /LENGTH=188 /DNA_ID=CAMNT_0039341681 /DNA_START=30 /DNA_END=596 /DNA_ORIENTATION=-